MPDLNASRIFELRVAPLPLTALYVGVLGATRRINRITLFQAAMGPQIQFASESFIDEIAATIAATPVAFRLLSDRAARHRHRQGRRPGQRARLGLDGISAPASVPVAASLPHRCALLVSMRPPSWMPFNGATLP
jgi:hypothetical protein